MKRFFSVFLLFALLFACAAAGFDIFYLKKSSENLNSRNVTVNRINAELNELIGQNTDNVEEIIAGHIGSWRKKYGKYAPDSMEYIGHSAFCSTLLESVKIPSGITRVNAYVFSDCVNLKNSH